MNAYPIVLYKPRTPVSIAPVYMCGNLHRTFYVACDEDGDWTAKDYGWFDTMEKAVLWALLESRYIANWPTCLCFLNYKIYGQD